MITLTRRERAVALAIWRVDRQLEHDNDSEAEFDRLGDERLTLQLHRAQAAISAADGGETPVSAADLCDALGCFWNAALGATNSQNDATANAVISGMAQGMEAVAVRLGELSQPVTKAAG